MQWPPDPFDEAQDQQAWAALLAYAARKKTTEVAPRVRVHGLDLGRWLVDVRARYRAGLLPPAQIEAMEALPHWRWGDLRQRDWAAFLQALTRFVAHRYAQTKTHPVVLGDAVYDGYRIGVWVGQQRAAHAAGTLDPARITLLEQVPGWVWEDPDPWDRGLPLLRQHLRDSGGSLIAEDLIEEGFPLGRWVARMRAARESAQLPSDRVQALEELPGWEWRPRVPPTPWEVGFHALARFSVQTGAADPAQTARIDGYPVGMWVHTQRRRYKTGTLPAEQAQALTSLPGWLWSAHDRAWQRGYEALVHHHDQVGALPGPSSLWNGYAVGQWVRVQRTSHRAGRLAAHRVASLEALTFWVWE